MENENNVSFPFVLLHEMSHKVSTAGKEMICLLLIIIIINPPFIIIINNKSDHQLVFPLIFQESLLIS